MSNPLCPVTGEPAVRRLQWIKARSLARLWKTIHGVNARPSFGQVQRFGLWESPTGLYFFDPMIEGDHAFYTQYYDWALRKKLWSRDTIREEFLLAARHVKPGDRVLDVGCGFGSFRDVIPREAQARRGALTRSPRAFMHRVSGRSSSTARSQHFSRHLDGKAHQVGDRASRWGEPLELSAHRFPCEPSRFDPNAPGPVYLHARAAAVNRRGACLDPPEAHRYLSAAPPTRIFNDHRPSRPYAPGALVSGLDPGPAAVLG